MTTAVSRNLRLLDERRSTDNIAEFREPSAVHLCLLAIGARRAPGPRATGPGRSPLLGEGSVGSGPSGTCQDAAAKPRGDILLEYWLGQRQQARHSDNQRS